MDRRVHHHPRRVRTLLAALVCFRGLRTDHGPLARMVRAVAWARVALAAAATVFGLIVPGGHDRVALTILTGGVALPYAIVILIATRRRVGYGVSPLTIAGDGLIVFAMQIGFPGLRATGLVFFMLLVAIYTPLAGMAGGLAVAAFGAVATVVAHVLNPSDLLPALAVGLAFMAFPALAVVIAAVTKDVREQMRRRVSVVSHEMRSAMTSIAGFAGTLADRWEALTDFERREYVTRIQRNAVSVNNIVAMLLESSEIERGRVRVRPERFDLAEFVFELCDSCRPLLGERHVDLDLPPGIVVDTDPLLLERIMMNLVLNAHGYSPPETALGVSAKFRDGELTVTVMDRGAGIPAGTEQRIFESFWRPADQSRSGTGIGLGLARDLLASMGGRIWVDARPGGGSAFSFTLPHAAGKNLRSVG